MDAANAFNSVNRYHMLWAVRHEWTTGSQLVLRNDTFHITIIPRREGVTQGDPLEIIFYGITSLSLIRALDESDATWNQIWYADDAGILGKFSDILKIYQKIQTKGPQWGYHPEPWKSILVVIPITMRICWIPMIITSGMAVTAMEHLH